MSFPDHYSQEIARFLGNCTRCGTCAEECPILPYTDLSEESSQKIQSGVFDFVENGTFNQQAYTKAFACMECFKCTAGMCPEDLNPMLVNEIIKGEYISKGLASDDHGEAGQPDSAHRVLANLQVSKTDYGKITKASNKRKARYVFFPGCNVYFQPEKILSAIDIMDAVGDDYAFLPGLDYCCGNSFLFSGKIAEGGRQAQSLVAAIVDFQPEAVVLWCPTCLCRFDLSISPVWDVPFQVLSFPQYLAANMKKLRLSDAAAGTVTLHEACKSAYTGLDRHGPREVLHRIPGLTLREMKHHGKEAMCCGSGAASWFPECGTQFREARLNEAAQTGAEQLITVCHYCNQTFAAESSRYDFTVTSYVHLVAEAMGIPREDKFRLYVLWGDLDRILEDAGEHIRESPFEKKRILEVLRTVFIP